MSDSRKWRVNLADFDKMQNALKEFEGNAEEAINDVLHNYGGQTISDSVQRLMPVSGANWRGKPLPAKTAKSLRSVNGNLAVTVTTTKKYQYLYFPDDGTNTRRHIGNQRFFERGGEAVKDDIIERCIVNLTKKI